MSKTVFARETIAAEISDLRQIRFQIADLHGIAYGLLRHVKAVDVDAELRADLLQAIELIDACDKRAASRINDLYHMPTPANDIEEAA